MNVRSQISMMFHLDKCIGCHTCSVACKNTWTDRAGAEYMWWNNVETKPGTGYPTLYEDQEKYKGGWEAPGGKLRLRLHSRSGGLANIFFNPRMPSLDEYYEPWTYSYGDLFTAPAGDDQPTARPISQITGKPMEITAGPNWDDDLGGSPIYAENDPNLKHVTAEEKKQLFDLERMVYFYLPRICNHCVNPGCVAACPSGAAYKRGEDGIVLVNQETCRGWRMCVSGCPYKKVYFNWSTGKSEKCILCYPRQEAGQPPACFHSCVGRIRYLGVLLYDADRIQATASSPNERLVDAQREMILDPHDPSVLRDARAAGIPEDVLESAKKSPVFKFVKAWKLALPLHPEFRTVPMLFYVPPLLPVIGRMAHGAYESSAEYFSALESARIPVSYFASLFSAGNTEVITGTYKKLIAARIVRRSRTVGDMSPTEAAAALAAAGMTAAEADEMYALTTLTTLEERCVIPPFLREEALDLLAGTETEKGASGFGSLHGPKRGF